MHLRPAVAEVGQDHDQRGYMQPEQYDRAKQGWPMFFYRIAERLGNA